MKTHFFAAVALVLTAIGQSAGAQESKPIIHMKSNNVVVERINNRLRKADGIKGIWITYTIGRTTSPNRYTVEFCDSPSPFDEKSVLATIQAAVAQDKKLELSFQKHGEQNCIVDANLIID